MLGVSSLEPVNVAVCYHQSPVELLSAGNSWKVDESVTQILSTKPMYEEIEIEMTTESPNQQNLNVRLFEASKKNHSATSQKAEFRRLGCRPAVLIEAITVTRRIFTKKSKLVCLGTYFLDDNNNSVYIGWCDEQMRTFPEDFDFSQGFKCPIVIA